MEAETQYRRGDKIGGRYEVHKVLVGGMGEVYLCLDLKWNRPFALKTFQASYLQNAKLRDSFEREVATWVALEKHPNIVRCFYMDLIDDRPFMILEWIASDESVGTDLRSWLRKGPLAYRLALGFAIDVCRGLSYAAQKMPGIVHRDLKPDNVLIAQGPIAKITDFGLAKVFQEANVQIASATHEPACRTSNIGGTPLYMAPEQWQGGILDSRTDIYAVGCILYEMLTGQWPFEAERKDELRDKHLLAPIPTLMNDASFFTAANQIIQRCMAKRKEARFGTADELLLELCVIYEQQFSEAPKPVDISGEFAAVDYNNRGMSYAHLRRYEDAVSDYTNAIRLAPTFAGAYSNRGLAYEMLKRYPEALADFTEAITLDPAYMKAHYNRGHVYETLERYDDALVDYGTAIRIEPTNADSWYNRGNIYLRLQRYEEAISDFTRTIELNPNHAFAFNNRGWTYSLVQRYDEALADLNHAISMDSTSSESHLNRGITIQ
jgi:serine/threonine protein kinase